MPSPNFGWGWFFVLAPKTVLCPRETSDFAGALTPQGAPPHGRFEWCRHQQRHADGKGNLPSRVDAPCRATYSHCLGAFLPPPSK